ncbi:PIG-L family deacetylase [Sphingomonas koreensis]|nr:PIG-L family deacetylase [Sphingomonas koreensis]
MPPPRAIRIREDAAPERGSHRQIGIGPKSRFPIVVAAAYDCALDDGRSGTLEAPNVIEPLSADRVAVIAPHPDDEVLGCGGTIARLTAGGAEVHVVIATRGRPPQFSESYMAAVMAEAETAHRLLGVTQTHRLDLPAAALDAMPAAEINARLGECLDAIAPDTLFIPFVGDIHLDHQACFTAAMVWARPRRADAPAQILAYETLSETNWAAPGTTPAFLPNCFIDIADQLTLKIDAFAAFRSQAKAFPDERSPEAIRALATMRGATVFCRAAEAFMIVRQIVRAS